MPSRMACVAILVFWMYAASALFLKDVLPNLILIPPPDLRTIARAEVSPARTEWIIQVADDPGMKSLSPVGSAYTESVRKADGSTLLRSEARFDSERLFRGTPYQFQAFDRAIISNRCEIDPTGNLLSFHADCRTSEPERPFVSLDGLVLNRQLIVKISSPINDPILQRALNRSQTFPYTPRGMIQNAVGPLDRMPGLQVGQRWESRVVSPLTGSVMEAKVEVTGKHAIHWGSGVVTTLEVVHRIPPLVTARTWVRPDGLVLRQEVPFPFVKLILERVPLPGDLPTEKPSP